MAARRKKGTPTIDTLTVPSDYTLGNTGITQTLLSQYLACPRAWLFAVNGYTNPDKVKKTRFGTMIHAYTDAFHGEFMGRAPVPFSAIMLRPEIIRDTTPLSADDAKDCELDMLQAEVVCEAYAERYREEDGRTKQFVNAERTHAAHYLDTYLLRTKIDAEFVHRDTQDTRVYILETKTISRLEESRLALKLHNDFQTMFEATVLAHEPAPVHVGGVCYNIVRRPQIKPKVGESLTVYRQRLVADIRSRPDFYFIRYTIGYTDRDLAAFEQDLQDYLSSLECNMIGRFRRNLTSCTGREYVCDYIDDCIAGRITTLVKQPLFVELQVPQS